MQEDKLYELFIKHKDDFFVLYNAGVFDLKNGNMVIHKDHTGVVRKIEVNQILFKT